MIRRKNTRPVGQTYHATVKSTWRSLSMWWGRILMSAGLLDVIAQLIGASATITPYLGKYAGLIFVGLGIVNQWLRRRATSAVK